MPPLPVIANTFRCAFEWSGAGGVNPVNVMHFRTVSPPQTAPDLADDLDAHVTATMWGPVTNTAHVARVRITPLDGTSATYERDHTATSPWQGGSGGDYMPALAAVVKFQTLLRGRSKRGRVFLGPITESTNDDGFLNSVYVAAGQTAWDNFGSAMLTAGWELVVASYKLGSAESVTSLSQEVALATQRRRQTRIRT